MKTAALLLAISLSCLSADVESQIRGREKAWGTAVGAGDTTTLAQLFTDDLIYAHASGAIESKREYLDRMKTGKQKYASVKQQKLRVVVHGDTVVAHSIMRMKGVSNDKPFDDHLMMLHVWLKQGNTWRLAAHQTARLTN